MWGRGGGAVGTRISTCARVYVQLIAASLKEHTNQMCLLELLAPVKQHETLI